MREIRGNERSPFYANNHKSTLHQTIVAHNLWIFWILHYIELHIFHYLDFSKLTLIKRLFQKPFSFSSFYAELVPECQQDPKENLS